MSKKILNEAQIRRWGKLASIGKPLTENWLDHLTEEDEELAAEEPAAEEEAPLEEPAGEEPAAEEAPEADAGMEDKVEDIVSAVVDAIADVTDVDISMDAGDEEPAAEEEPAEEEEEVPAMRDEMHEESLNLEVIDDEELTEAVLKRVVERLLKRK